MEYSIKFILIYLLMQIAFVIGSYIFYFSFIRRLYLKKKKLPFFTGMSQLLIFIIHALLLYLPYFIYGTFIYVNVGKIQKITGLFICFFGLLILLAGFINLGSILKTMGIVQNKLSTGGVYKFTRNPQVIGYGIFIVSFVFLWPSWYIIISFISYMLVVHWMVLTEEINLRNLFGKDYDDYCKRTPRYFFNRGLKKRGGNISSTH